ncbi:substrate-binding domain-containing protein [Hymenobacter volaticus]|uniref:Substrate-binding domain-containing protein n=1 Tax=Hymenobacter volaticus TaxID=2932254 RepID=A0ABY4GDQ9_9BACT|nr:substrate-binding domain-containing protein [Hymenobacter volaticus]UOQ68902.1 substrate-binding domain-containing protein [Hymenobacter volaticus]
MHHKLDSPAGHLSPSESKTLAVFIPEVPNHFFSLALKGIEEMARCHHYQVLVYLTSEVSQPVLVVERLLASGRVDGVLVSAAAEQGALAQLRELQERNLPILFFDDVYEELETAKASTDDYEGSYRATSHLVQMGCRHIVHVALPQNLVSGRRRLQGYRDALTDSGLLFHDDSVLIAKSDQAKDVAQIQYLLQNRLYIDGIVAATESAVASSYEACRNLGRAIPKDVKVVGFPAQKTAMAIDSAPTATEQFTYVTGEEAARLLLHAIATNQPVLSREREGTERELSIKEYQGWQLDVVHSLPSKHNSLSGRQTIPLNTQLGPDHMLGQVG